MKILIADDELLERKAMKKFIHDNLKNMEVVGEAVNGRKAIELAKELQPDIIFMDIKMPGINGLEAIEQIHATQPATKFILVSAYDTFEYAKQAMQFGIKDYIVKPGNKEEIINALFRLEKEIDFEVKREEEKEQSAQLLRESFIRKLMKQPIQEDTFDLQNQLFPRMKSGYFLVMSGNDFSNVQQIEKSLEKHLQDTFIVHEANDVFVVSVLLDEYVTKADQLILARKLYCDFGKSMFIGIGDSYDSLGHLPSSYREAYAACFQLKSGNKSNYGFAQKEQPNPSEDHIAGIVQEVEKGNHEEAISRFKENEHILQVTDKEDLYIVIQSILSRRNLSIAKGSIATLQSNKDWHTYLQVCCIKINDFYQSKQSMTIAKEYIETHYSNGITLEDVAALVNLSPNYFSNLFKEEFGETFIEFLTKTRMQQAKELIEENIYSLKEISFKVGYKDPNYFSRVFKRYYHSSPRQFQDSIFEK